MKRNEILNEYEMMFEFGEMPGMDMTSTEFLLHKEGKLNKKSKYDKKGFTFKHGDFSMLDLIVSFNK